MLGPGGVVGDRRFWLRDEEGAPLRGKRSGALLRSARTGTRRRAGSRSLPGREPVDGIVELGEPVAAELYRQPRPSHRVIGPWEAGDLAASSGEPLTPALGRRRARSTARRRAARSRSSRGGRSSGCGAEAALTERSTAGASGCCSRSTASGRTRRTTGSAQRCRIGEATVRFNGDIGRCVVTSRDPDTRRRSTSPTLDILAALPAGGAHRDAAVRRLRRRRRAGARPRRRRCELQPALT